MERRLSAIFVADMVGYSRLMEADELGTLERQKAHRRELIDPAFEEFHGRIVKEMGDGLLVEFPSVVEAVQCAVKIQREMLESQADQLEDCKIQYRIGINLGDVIVDGDDLYGDGVNVAARLEQLAEPDGVCISGAAFETLRSFKNFGFQSLGEVKVKNIDRPIPAYKVIADNQYAEVVGKQTRVSMPNKKMRFTTAALVVLLVIIAGGSWIWWLQRPDFEPVDAAQMALKLPDKPSIAVLPFANLSDDASQNYFADGLTEDIIIKLASLPNLFVIGRNSTERYRGKDADARIVAQNLGVKYVLHGTVRRSGNTLRLTVGLTDAVNGMNLWAEKYDREIADVFALQDEITSAVTQRLASNIVDVEFNERTRGGTRNLEAYDYFLRGWQVFRTINPKSNSRALQLFEKAIEADQNYARAHSGLAMAHANNASFGWANGSEDTLDSAIEIATRAVELDPNDRLTHYTVGSILRYQGKFEKAVEAYERALLRSPSNPDVLIGLALAAAFSGSGATAVEHAQTALRLNPHPPPHYYAWQGISYYVNEQYDKALKSAEKFQTLNPKFFLGYFWTTLSNAQLGQMAAAKSQKDKLLALRPDLTFKAVLDQNKAKGRARQLIIEGSRKAGIPENPPPKIPDKPSIAVLPFENMSNDPEQDYFAEGIAVDLLTSLSKLASLHVAERSGSFLIQSQKLSAVEIGKSLGVDYLLQGSVRKAGKKVRINARLTETKSGRNKWAERYDGELRDVFALQDAVTGDIIEALSLSLGIGEKERLTDHGTANIEAHDAFLRGQKLARTYSADDARKAEELYLTALKLDPNYKRATEALEQIRFIQKNSGLK